MALWYYKQKRCCTRISRKDDFVFNRDTSNTQHAIKHNRHYLITHTLCFGIYTKHELPYQPVSAPQYLQKLQCFSTWFLFFVDSTSNPRLTYQVSSLYYGWYKIQHTCVWNNRIISSSSKLKLSIDVKLIKILF